MVDEVDKGAGSHAVHQVDSIDAGVRPLLQAIRNLLRRAGDASRLAQQPSYTPMVAALVLGTLAMTACRMLLTPSTFTSPTA